MIHLILHLFLLWTGVLSQTHPIPRFIISPWGFFDICNASDPYNTSQMSGIEFNVVRDAFKIAGYEEGVDFIFECLPWPDCTDAVYNAKVEDNVLGVIEALPINAGDLADGFTILKGRCGLASALGISRILRTLMEFRTGFLFNPSLPLSTWLCSLCKWLGLVSFDISKK